MTETPNVVQAIAAVARDMTAIGKARTSQGYKYRGIDDLYNAIHEPLAKHGVLVVPTVLDHQIIDVTINSKPWAKHVVRVQYDVYGPAGDQITGVVVAEGLDNSDKGTGKALSYAFKSFVHQLLAVPTEDPAMDNEHADAVVDQVSAPVQVDPRELLGKKVDALKPFLRSVFDHKIAAQGWQTIEDIPDDKLGAALKTADVLADDGEVTKGQKTKLGILGGEVVAAGLVEDIAEYVSDHTNGRTSTRTELLKSEAGKLIEEWETLTP